MKTPHVSRHALRPAGGHFSRREFAALLGGAMAGSLAGCTGLTGGSDGRAELAARPGAPSGSVSPGLVRLGNGDIHDGYLYVPAGYQAGTPAPLVLALHGAGGNVTGPLALLSPYAEASHFLIVAVNSSEATWDGVQGKYGPDVKLIDVALQRAFARCNVDPARVVLEGFSDGATYALGLGLANGGLFTRIVAFSPGFIHESGSGRHGHPEFFISHGRQDEVLSIDATSRQIVPALRNDGYQVNYQEFEGGHQIPPDVAQAAVTWFLR